MIVQPDFLDHWKTKLLQKKLGETAPLVLLRLWAYCQVQRQWKLDLPSEALGALCDWPGDPEELSQALQSARFIRLENDRITVLNWDEHNAGIITNWNNGKRGGRPRKEATSTDIAKNAEKDPKKPTGFPPDTDGIPTANPVEPTANPWQTQSKPNKNKNKNKRKEKVEKENADATAAHPKNFLDAWNGLEGSDIRTRAEAAGCADLLRDAALGFEAARREGKHPLTGQALKLMLADLRKCDPAVAVALLDDAVKNGTRGWYWPEKAERFASQTKISTPPSRASWSGSDGDPRAAGLIYQG